MQYFGYHIMVHILHIYYIYLDLLTEIHERNCALKAVGREKETETIGLVVSVGVGNNPVGKYEKHKILSYLEDQ